MKILIVTLSLFMAHAAFADQCAVVPVAQANKAVSLLKKLAKDAKPVTFHCAPCGETGYAVETVRNVSIEKFSSYERTLKVNHKGIDLAYTYVWVAKGKYRNLAKIVGCPADGVSEFIKF